MSPVDVAADRASSSLPWYRQVDRDQWRAFWATFLGWVLDGFDFTILTFILVDIQQSFTVDRALAGALGTVTLFTRLIGGVAAGTAADRWGRRLPLMVSILWFSLFAFLSGFSTSYTMLFALRALFGIGMGGEWAAGMPLVLEHWPAHLRGLASGLLQGGFSWGFLLAAGVFQFVYPLFSDTPDLGWRVMMWIGVFPALLVLWIRRRVPESPVWLERQRRLRDGGRLQSQGTSLWRLFQADLIGTTVQTSVLMSAFMFSYYSLTFWYATFLREGAHSALPYLAAFNVGAVIGGVAWGHLSETRLGRRGAVSLAALLGVLIIPLYLYVSEPWILWVGALLMGCTGAGIFGMAPSYLTERFPTEARGVGAGLAYHAGAAIGSLTPAVLGSLQVAGWSLQNAMASGIAIAGVLVASVIWLGPETRAQEFTADR
ncbi:MAG TPA: MFS transporter [Vicinamibacterales bacterium]|jgi:SHS family lactate transporter-like MFS transporter|nr:MFS transporter [Vicinamibacterales bacterium]